MYNIIMYIYIITWYWCVNCCWSDHQVVNLIHTYTHMFGSQHQTPKHVVVMSKGASLFCQVDRYSTED